MSSMDNGQGLQHDQITLGKEGGTITLNKDSTSFLNFIDNMKLVDTDMNNDLFT